MNTKEQQILNLLKKKDKVGLEMLLDTYYIPLCLFSAKMVDNYSTAEDIVQETFIHIWEKKVAQNIVGSLRSYLFTAVKNNSLKQINKNKRFIFEEVLQETIEFPAEVEDQDQWEERKEQLLNEIDALPPKMKRVFEAIVFENMKYKEIADEMKVSVNTIKTQFSRSLKQLRGSIDLLILFLLFFK